MLLGAASITEDTHRAEEETSKGPTAADQTLESKGDDRKAESEYTGSCPSPAPIIVWVLADVEV